VIRSAGYSSPRDSKSARSFLRPVARLLIINCFLPIYETDTSPKRPGSFEASASSHVTPLIDVNKSMRTGGSPS
jgi:hypothetical protein